jgi:UDP-N-acetylglucosamine/UDP-N-acetylgalactosamine diphosphorylase
MTSTKNHEDTVRHFRDHACFGLDPSAVHFFAQANLPAVDLTGRILLDRPSRIAESPNGHGGVIDALLRSGCLERMRETGVEHVFYFQVDNPLVRILDPVFVGHHLHQGASISTKIVRKRDAAERVGVLAKSGGSVHVVEYSDFPPEIANARSPDGRLLFEGCASSIPSSSSRPCSIFSRPTTCPRLAVVSRSR